jgi:PAS domain S-box-containing protein
MAFDPSPSLRRDIGVGTVSGLGIATFLTVYLHVQRLDAAEGAAVLVGLFGLLLSAPLVVGGLQLLRQRYEPGEALRITGWVLVGSIPLLLITLVLVSFSAALQIVLGDPFILLSGLVALGGLAGLAFGLYELELRRAKASVQATANRLDAIISGSPMPIVAVDPDGRVTMWNDAAAETFKYDPEEVLGEQYPLAPDDRVEEVERHLEQLRAGEDLLGVETVRERADGVLVDVEIWTARLVEDGSFEGAVALIADVSDRKRREQELQVLHRVLRHNLRNDLNVIQGNAGLIERSLEPLESVLDRLDTAQASASADLQEAGDSHAEDGPPSEPEIHSTLDSNLPETLEYTALVRQKSEELIDLTAKAQRAETILRSTEEEHHPIAVETLIDYPIRDLELEYPEATVEVSVEQDLRVLVNGPVGIAVRELAENAVVHADVTDPHIAIECWERAGRACIDVHDDGPGIPAEERRVIAEGEESSMLHSSGLGLWLANWLVDRAGGTLSFETDADGSMARIVLPLATETADQA